MSRHEKRGFTLTEILVTLLVFSITFIAIISLYTRTTGNSLKFLNRVDIYGRLFSANNILQAEILKAGPDIKYIKLVRLEGEEKYKGLRYSVFIPLTKTKITKQVYFKDGQIKVWEKNFQASDFSSETVKTLEPAGAKIIMATSPLEDLEIEFTSLGARSVNYRITIKQGGKSKLVHESSVFLINMR
ncbi:type IV pilus modification PilV family protein [Kosmotoga pacifica]|uniref:N-terminal cleavage protein n=1 Tax=Kosmotoga pacifica TaxID=1330330 RepID=A0A0G2Z850_9BACT|nr:prepilin-type N-terminal cleavage/methylation domain-containing protein [Kosmotoga pacifica]AKI97742.1 hypothetical protein IX53_07870 [Kosmotoga pacifica]